MRDTIAWSYDLLSPLEQSLLCRLSIFDGDCSLEAIEAVCSGRRRVVVAPNLTAPASWTRSPRSSISTSSSPTTVCRMRPGSGCWSPSGSSGVSSSSIPPRCAHCDPVTRTYYATLVEHAAVALQSPAARTWARRLEHELVEVRAALRHFVEVDDVVGGLRMVTGAGRFWLNDGHVAEGRHWLAELLSRVTPELIPVRERAAALMWTARLAMDDLPSAELTARSTILTQLDAGAHPRSLDPRRTARAGGVAALGPRRDA